MTDKLPARRKEGRRSKFTPELRRQILRLIKSGLPITHAARAAGITHQSLRNYQQACPVFEDACRKALSDGIKRRIQIVEECCRSKDPAIRLRAATWWLSHVPGAAEHFSESRRIEISGELDGRVAVLVWPHHAPKEIAENANNSIAGTTPDAG